jgi:hypothetical protein
VALVIALTPVTTASAMKFTLAPNPVVNPPSRAEWTVDASAGSATWKHCCDAGKWESQYGFKLPGTLTTGGSDPLALSVTAASCESGSGCNFAVSARGDGVPNDRSLVVHADFQKTASDSKSLTISVPDSASDTSELHIVIALGDGPEITYTYKRACCTPAVAVPPPAAFGQTVTFAAPAPGGAVELASPKLPPSGGVTVELGGLSEEDTAVFAAARKDCIVNFTKMMRELTGATTLAEQITAEYTILFLTLGSQLEACMNYVAAVEQVVAERGAPPASASATSGCPLKRVKLSLSGTGANTRLKSFRLSSAGGSHQALKVTCKRRAGKLTMTVASGSKRKSLRKIVGSRLRFGIVRSSKDPPGGNFAITFRRR